MSCAAPPFRLCDSPHRRSLTQLRDVSRGSNCSQVSREDVCRHHVICYVASNGARHQGFSHDLDSRPVNLALRRQPTPRGAPSMHGTVGVKNSVDRAIRCGVRPWRPRPRPAQVKWRSRLAEVLRRRDGAAQLLAGEIGLTPQSPPRRSPAAPSCHRRRRCGYTCRPPCARALR